MGVATHLSGAGLPRWPSQLPRARATRAVQNFVLIFLGISIVALYSSYRRPIWIDEMLHFAWGGINDPLTASGDVLQPLIEGTAPTWFATSWLYFLADIGLLKVFGADSTALRAPSLVAGLALLGLVVFFFRRLGFGFIWQVLILLVLLAQTTYMYYIGEARPYLPLSLAVVGLFVYYSRANSDQSLGTVTTVAWVAGLGGALLHTYVLFYALALAVGFGWLNAIQVPKGSRQRCFVSFLNLPLLLSMLAIELVTRLPSLISTQGTDSAWQGGPWEFLTPAELPNLFLFAHFGFLPSLPLTLSTFALAFSGVLIIGGARSWWSLNEKIGLTRPLLLIVLALVVSAIISLVSFLQGYWILARHWTVSGFLVPIGLVWLWAEMSRALTNKANWVSLSIPVILIVAFGALAPWKVNERVQALNEYSAIAMAYKTQWAGTTAVEAEALWGKADVQNINIYLGGPVWPVNACFSPVRQNCPPSFEIPK